MSVEWVKGSGLVFLIESTTQSSRSDLGGRLTGKTLQELRNVDAR